MTWQQFLYGGDLAAALKGALVCVVVWFILDDVQRKMNRK